MKKYNPWQDFDKEELEKQEKQQIDDERKMVLITILTMVIGSLIIWLLVSGLMEVSKWASTLN